MKATVLSTALLCAGGVYIERPVRQVAHVPPFSADDAMKVAVSWLAADAALGCKFDWLILDTHSVPGMLYTGDADFSADGTRCVTARYAKENCESFGGSEEKYRALTTVLYYGKGEMLVVSPSTERWCRVPMKDCKLVGKWHKPASFGYGRVVTPESLTKAFGANILKPEVLRTVAFLKNPRQTVSVEQRGKGKVNALKEDRGIGATVSFAVESEMARELSDNPPTLEAEMRLLVHEDGAVVSATVLLHSEGSEVTDKNDASYWDMHIVFRDFRTGGSLEIPKPVQVLLGSKEGDK